ncbi:hypothetical protein NSPZN2_10832 [Nitrospira defluvii]|uniref:Uncharacterized protein n=1 Tax=Nitrospira defluvii TaxID=330214 RepID=A0ABM8QLB7_9BACT|nr:hypothetical protein NSPZN2_10832 [Nitrospira defluvii]
MSACQPEDQGDTDGKRKQDEQDEGKGSSLGTSQNWEMSHDEHGELQIRAATTVARGVSSCPCARSRERLSDPTQEVRDPVGDQGRERSDGDEHVKIEFHGSSPVT